ncbi:Probable cell division protein ytgP [uncultured Clostridium sp.]|uniref:putative polysaccharide biosynthesis protein n=1 Tax=uncultured Clostridium sp. TaxID=59620 RepID=UPI000823393C|nr:polysaccharide biosynthesis protein [uncultured Clostridium sp.]SCJ72457.1 Probable cell division protein ytgP [uncultured Clostridium sp.]
MEEKSVGRSFLILSLAGVLVKILSAVYIPLLTLIIGSAGYGIYSSSYSAFVFILAVTSMGAQPAITKVVAELKALGYHKDAYNAMKIARNYLAIFGFAFMVIFIAFGDGIANGMNSPSSALSLKFLAPTILLSAMLAAYRGYMQGVDSMKEIAVSQVVEQIFNVVFSLIFAFLLKNISLEWGSAGGTVGTTIGALIAIVYVIYIFNKNDYYTEAVRSNEEGKRISKKRIINKLIQYGLPITMVAAVQNSAGLIDAIIVKGRLLAAGFEQIRVDELFGTLNYFNTLIYVPLTIVTALCTAIFPRIIASYVQKNRKELKNQISYSYRLTYLITIPAAIGLSVLSKEIFLFLLNDSYGYQMLAYGSIVLIFMSITSIQNTILQGVNKLYLVLTTASIGILIKFVVNFILVGIKDINIFGAVIGSVFAFLIPAIINHKRIQRLFKIRIPIIRQGMIPLMSSIIMGVVVVICKGPLLRLVNIFEGGRIAIGIVAIVSVAIGGLVYLIAMILLHGLRKEDLDLISPRLYEVMPRILRKKIK